MRDIKFVVRDTYGHWHEVDFDSRNNAYQYCVNMNEVNDNLEYEVMYITIDNVCVYSSLMTEGLDYETLVAWFA